MHIFIAMNPVTRYWWRTETKNCCPAREITSHFEQLPIYIYIYIHIVSVISSRKFYNIFNWTPPHWLHMACCLLASHSPPHHQRNASGEKPKKTRWSPRTRMLTRMLMVQMSKHMVMQSRTIPFCNSLLEQSCACFPCYQSAVWSGKCRVWSVK